MPELKTKEAKEEELIAKLNKWFSLAESHHTKWESQAKRDLDFYLGKQWDAVDLDLLKREKRPALTLNRIKSQVNLVSGTERQNRRDIKAINKKGGSRILAEVLTKLIKDIMDSNNGDFEKSHAFLKGIITSRGWLGINLDFEDDIVNGNLIVEELSPFRIYVDPFFEKYNLSDAMFIFKIAWLPKDKIEQTFPDKKKDLTDLNVVDVDKQTIEYGDKYKESTATSAGGEVKEYKYRVKECWWIDYKKTKILINTETGETRDVTEIADKKTKKITESLKKYKVIERTKKVLHLTVYVGNVILQDIEDPFNGVTMYPLVPFFAYWIENEWRSMVTDLQDPQQEINKRRSQLLHHLNLSANSGWIGDEDAVEDWSVVEDFGSKPGVIIKRRKNRQLERITPAPVSEGHLLLSKLADDDIKIISGVNADLLGMEPERHECVTPDTECLTKTGFKKYNQLHLGEEIYTVNPKTLQAEWKPIQKIYTYGNYNGEMINIEGRNLSACVTPNHKWLVKKHGRTNRHIFIEAKDFKGINGIPISAKPKEMPTFQVYSDDFVELLGWVVTEGCYQKNNEIMLSQSLRANFKKAQRLKTLIKKMYKPRFGKGYHIGKDKCMQLRIAGKLGKKIKDILPDKKITYDFINSLPINQLKILKDTLIAGDGNIRKNNERFFTTDEQMKDIFEYICILLGENCKSHKYLRNKIPNHKDYYECFVKKSKYVTPFNRGRRTKDKEYEIKTIQYKGIIWCPNTENQTFFAKRNDKIYITGNSGIAMQLRQKQGNIVIEGLFDNLRLSEKILGQLLIQMIQRSGAYSREEMIKIVMEGKEQEVAVNKKVMNEYGAIQKIENDLSIGRYDVTITSSPAMPTIRLANLHIMLEMVRQGFPIPPDMIIEQSDMPNKEQFIERMKQAQPQVPKEEIERGLKETELKLKATIEKARLEQEAQLKREEFALKTRLKQMELAAKVATSK